MIVIWCECCGRVRGIDGRAEAGDFGPLCECPPARQTECGTCGTRDFPIWNPVACGPLACVGCVGARAAPP